jgi:peptidoglycan/xylan/chitin deacetylase (PgdA/CDA1 family)
MIVSARAAVMLALALGSCAHAQSAACPPCPAEPRLRTDAARLSPVASDAKPFPIDVAITVDDLPRHGPDMPGVTRLSIHEAFLTAFRAHRVPPVYGFVVGGSLDEHPEDRTALRAWVAGGQLLGNHTRSHPDLQQISVAAYLADLDANEPLLRELSRPTSGRGELPWRVFRYPFLVEGTDLRSRAAIREHLLARGYRIAPVTIDFYDWAYNDPYARCLARHDERATRALKKSYLDDALLFLRWADAAARATLGRPLEQILLLHIGAFDAVMIDALLSLYERQGVRFVSLDAALADPAYASELQNPKAWDGTFLSQMREARGVENPPEPNLPEGLLDALCR